MTLTCLSILPSIYISHYHDQSMSPVFWGVFLSVLPVWLSASPILCGAQEDLSFNPATLALRVTPTQQCPHICPNRPRAHLARPGLKTRKRPYVNQEDLGHGQSCTSEKAVFTSWCVVMIAVNVYLEACWVGRGWNVCQTVPLCWLETVHPFLWQRRRATASLERSIKSTVCGRPVVSMSYGRLT